jgi:hypothetical protein
LRIISSRIVSGGAAPARICSDSERENGESIVIATAPAFASSEASPRKSIRLPPAPCMKITPAGRSSAFVASTMPDTRSPPGLA